MVRRVKPKDKTSGGIILPDSAQEKTNVGEVIGVGRGRTLDDGTVIPVDVKVGDTILLTKFTGTEIRHEGEDLIMIKESDIACVVIEE